MDTFYAYLPRCADGSYYVGHTDDLEHRLAQHASGALGGYTSTRRSIELLWSDSFSTRDDAFATERRLKGWSRAKKEALVRGDEAALRDLAKRRTPDRH